MNVSEAAPAPGGQKKRDTVRYIFFLIAWGFGTALLAALAAANLSFKEFLEERGVLDRLPVAVEHAFRATLFLLPWGWLLVAVIGMSIGTLCWGGRIDAGMAILLALLVALIMAYGFATVVSWNLVNEVKMKSYRYLE